MGFQDLVVVEDLRKEKALTLTLQIMSEKSLDGYETSAERRQLTSTCIVSCLIHNVFAHVPVANARSIKL